MTKASKTYEELQKELDAVLAKIQDEDSKGNLSELLELYEKGEKLLEQMQDRLENAKNTIKKIDS